MKWSVKHRSLVARLLPVTFAVGLLASGAAGREPETAGAARLALPADAPLYFEPDSTTDGSARFLARGRDCSVLLAPTEALLILRDAAQQGQRMSQNREDGIAARTVRFELLDANPRAAMSGLDPLPGVANYLIGNVPAEWRAAVPLFSRVQADEIYPGTRVVYYANQSAELEYDFILQPGAEPDRIRFRIEGADRIRLNAAGDMVLAAGSEEVRQPKPVLYQEIGGVRRNIEGGYRLIDGTTVGFRVGSYDRSAPLVIDPILTFSTYLGGRKLDIGWRVALGPDNSIYVAGETLSPKGLPAGAGVFQPDYAGGTRLFGDAFVAKYDNTPPFNLLFLTYLGGKKNDGALGLAVDGTGVYLTGFTDSKDFPLTNAIRTDLTEDARNNNAARLYPVDGFVTKLDSTGSALVYSTLLGGSRRDVGVGIAVDASQNAYVAGITESTNFFPLSTNALQAGPQGKTDAFVTKLMADGSWEYSTYLGGTNQDYAESVAVDAAGAAHVIGYTTSVNFPTTNALTFMEDTNTVTFTNLNRRVNPSSGSDAFISKLSPDGTALTYSTYLGGAGDDVGLDIAVDGISGDAFATGYTLSVNFPTNAVTVPQGNTNLIGSQVFAIRIGPGGGADVVYSTRFGGRRIDQGRGIAVDANGRAYVTGFTTSPDFFATNAPPLTDLRSTNATVAKRARGRSDIFVAVLDPAGTNFDQSILLGGVRHDQANGIAVEPSGAAVYIAGQTASRDLPLTNASQTTLDGVQKGRVSDAFVGKIQFP